MSAEQRLGAFYTSPKAVRAGLREEALMVQLATVYHLPPGRVG